MASTERRTGASPTLAASLETLRTELRRARCDVHPLNLDALVSGEPAGYLPLLHFGVLRLSKPVARWVAELGYELYAKSDARFVEGVFRLMRQELCYRHTLSSTQFLASGFAEKKMLLVVQLLRLVKAKHAELARERGPKKPAVDYAALAELAVPRAHTAVASPRTPASARAVREKKAGADDGKLRRPSNTPLALQQPSRTQTPQRRQQTQPSPSPGQAQLIGEGPALAAWVRRPRTAPPMPTGAATGAAASFAARAEGAAGRSLEMSCNLGEACYWSDDSLTAGELEAEVVEAGATQERAWAADAPFGDGSEAPDESSSDDEHADGAHGSFFMTQLTQFEAAELATRGRVSHNTTGATAASAAPSPAPLSSAVSAQTRCQWDEEVIEPWAPPTAGAYGGAASQPASGFAQRSIQSLLPAPPQNGLSHRGGSGGFGLDFGLGPPAVSGGFATESPDHVSTLNLRQALSAPPLNPMAAWSLEELEESPASLSLHRRSTPAPGVAPPPAPQLPPRASPAFPTKGIFILPYMHPSIISFHLSIYLSVYLSVYITIYI